MAAALSCTLLNSPFLKLYHTVDPFLIGLCHSAAVFYKGATPKLCFGDKST